MSSLEEWFRVLEEDLTSTPMRISVYHDLPFAILRYDPWLEYECRTRVRLLSLSLSQNHNRRVKFISLAHLLWEAISCSVGSAPIFHLEKNRGFTVAQETVNRILSEREFCPIDLKILEEANKLDPKIDIIFLVRTGAFAPAIYRSAILLDQLTGKTEVPIILFYPGTSDASTILRFMNLPDRGSSPSNYRVKIYGGD
jgi:hypothetical protein